MSNEVLQQRLDDAETAYHNLMTGRSVVEVVDQNGERVKYDNVNAFRLANYINELKRKLGETSGPMQVIF